MEENKKSIFKNKLTFIILGIFILVVLILGIYILNFNSKENSMKKPIKVLMKTTLGDITIELYPDKAPITVENFLRYVDSGAYSGTVFHRVIKNFMIQGGGFNSEGVQLKTFSPIKLESKNGLKNTEGTIAMARTMIEDSATNQFFINTKDNPFLDYGVRDAGYAVFGKVISGMDVVKKIEESKTTIKHGMQDWPVEEVVIISVERI